MSEEVLEGVSLEKEKLMDEMKENMNHRNENECQLLLTNEDLP